MSLPPDSSQRKQATDPRRSFIIQAPAGSGKTELLTQRYLRLLGSVSAPEQIVALTFTRKAASEMRERIMAALENAACKNLPSSSHQQETYAYATAVLIRSDQLKWELLKQPTRLRVMTIDSLCQMITHAIPLQEKHIPFAKVTDIPQLHYKNAARACLFHAMSMPEHQDHIRCLLKHLDNKQDTLLTLFCDLLGSREQWLGSLYLTRGRTKAHFEKMLSSIEAAALERLKKSVPLTYQEEFRWLAQKLASLEPNPGLPRACLSEWEIFGQMDRDIALGLASMCLTSTKKLRRQFDHHVGLKKGICDENLYQALKTRSAALFETLSQTDSFLAALNHVNELPLPIYTPSQWNVLQALLNILPLLVGHLYLVFNEQNVVDFTGLSQQAITALGSDEEPTNLALYLDNAINHLLIDEFQDTSLQQFQLLSHLVRGWEPEDGRTLFLVGDPMQSIYRFRQAEVGLFLKAKEEGIGSIPLTFLELSCNFRATETLTLWVNEQFNKIFPALENIEMGAIRFHPSQSSQSERSDTTGIQAFECGDAQTESESIVDTISKELLRYPEETVAVLVRSRPQLTHITQQLREKNIPFQGVEIERLSTLPHLRDLWSLTQLLFYPANRLAWLTVLRAPWCGLTLADLHVIANINPKGTIQDALNALDTFETCNPESAFLVSKEGRERVTWVRRVIQRALARRYQQPLIDWIMETLITLKGKHLITSEEKADFEQFWLLLERFTTQNISLNLDQFNEAFNLTYSQRSQSSRLHIMTIHKAKGLEFDAVIIPHLGAGMHRQHQPLLRWLKIPTHRTKAPLFLVSPIKASSEATCLLYQYIGKIEAEKEYYERQRLLYVAVTRAKKRLYLFDCNEKEKSGTFRQLLRHQTFEPIHSSGNQEVASTTFLSEPTLYRLAQAYYATDEQYVSRFGSFPPKLMGQARIKIAPHSYARQLGVVTHELLQWICSHHPHTIENIPWGFVMRRFKSMGFSPEMQTAAYDKLYDQIYRFLDDPRATWIIQDHDEQYNEYALILQNETTQNKSLLETRIIDRTFIEKGIRWIIDFKTGSSKTDVQRIGESQDARRISGQQDKEQKIHVGENKREKALNNVDHTALDVSEVHQNQLNLYAKLFQEMMCEASTPHRIRCGLYYLEDSEWVEWEYEEDLSPLLIS